MSRPNTSAHEGTAVSIYLTAGDYIDIRGGVTVTITGGAMTTTLVAQMSIIRQGN